MAGMYEYLVAQAGKLCESQRIILKGKNAEISEDSRFDCAGQMLLCGVKEKVAQRQSFLEYVNLQLSLMSMHTSVAHWRPGSTFSNAGGLNGAAL